MNEFREGITEGSSGAQADGAQSVEEGYSSLEIAAESEADAAEPDHSAVIEDTVDEEAADEEKEQEKKE